MTENNDLLGKNEQKVAESTSEGARMRQEYEEIKKNRAKKEKKMKKQAKTVVVPEARASAEAILTKVCLKLKLTPPARIRAKATSKSQLGAFQAKNSRGFLKVTVRDHDIVVYCPVSYLGAGKPGPVVKKGDVIKDYSNLAIFRKDDPNLEKVFTMALKDKKSWAEWAPTATTKIQKEIKAVRKAKKTKQEKPAPMVTEASVA